MTDARFSGPIDYLYIASGELFEVSIWPRLLIAAVALGRLAFLLDGYYYSPSVHYRGSNLRGLMT